MATKEDWFAVVRERHNAVQWAMSLVLRARRKGHPTTRLAQDAARLAGLLADGWKELARLEGDT